MKTTLRILALSLVLLLTFTSCEKTEVLTLDEQEQVSLQPTYLCDGPIYVYDQREEYQDLDWIPLISFEFKLNSTCTLTFTNKTEVYTDWTFEIIEEYVYTQQERILRTMFLVTYYSNDIKKEMLFYKSNDITYTYITFTKGEYEHFDHLGQHTHGVLFYTEDFE